MKKHFTATHRCKSLHIKDRIVRLDSDVGPIVLHSYLTILTDDDYVSGFIDNGHVYATAYRFYCYDSQIRCAVHVKDLY